MQHPSKISRLVLSSATIADLPGIRGQDENALSCLAAVLADSIYKCEINVQGTSRDEEGPLFFSVYLRHQ